MAFMDERYLMNSDTALKLFEAVKDLPVVDPHNHANVSEIAANGNYPDLWRLFAATDHYVWEVLRKRGVPEEFITGDKSNKEKWLKLASVFPEVAGNPVYEWVHLDLRRGLGIETLIGPDTAEEIWEKGNAVLAEEGSRPQALLNKMNVEVMCSTDDPVDSLNEHEQVNSQMGRTILRPTWRPDKAMNIFSRGWADYIASLEKRFDMTFKSVEDLVAALRKSHDYFHEKGCRASDHGLEAPLCGRASAKKADKIFRAAYKNGKTPDADEQLIFMSYLLGEMAEMNAEKDWVTQLHIGAVRDVRDTLFSSLGPDSGGDVSNHFIDILPALKSFLNRFDDRLKVILYCLCPEHQSTLATISRAFGGKVRLGSAWWLCDTPISMRRQLEYIGSVDTLANFAGMVSDSRKLLSYQSRFEMFRRVLCDTVGAMVDYGQMPYEIAESLVKKMSYDNPKAFFAI